ncbi:MAG TPA: peptide chain release factor N(5)-glutamine methyltransferase [Nitrospiria bacterium]|nr:peptide chain release factor N(5)-glutamine methyltransferase [Nitrospiria bacterium]
MAATRGLQDWLQTATRILTEAGIPDGRREAETLIAHIMNRPRLDLYRADDLALDPDQQEAFTGLIRRRASREPLQYILGTQEFWGLEFRVTTDTLIPRPETELLIEAVLERFGRPAPPIMLVDLCTGSGCLAVTLATLYPTFRILATDRSPAALDVARSNALRHGMSDRIEFLEGDLLEPLASMGLHHRVDVMTANPPYVPAEDLDRLQPEVRFHEPRLALDGGCDGLDYYRRILPGALEFVGTGGRLLLEVGIRQAIPVRDMAEQTGWRTDRLKKDLAGIDRVVVLTKP